MKTHLECIPCFLNQALRIMKLQKTKNQVKIMRQIIKKLSSIDLNKSPPQFALVIYDIIEKSTGNHDFYKKIRQRDNLKAKQILASLEYEDDLRSIMKLAIAGNIMDFAISHLYDVEKTIKRVLSSDFAIDDFRKFKEIMKKAKKMAYISDNAGEIIFDGVFIKKLLASTEAEITLFVRGASVINDAVMEDARTAGLDKLDIKIKKVDSIFPDQRTINGFDLVISKGQANYECLSGSSSNIFFLLMAKCPVIAGDLGVKEGDIICKGGA